DIFLREDPTCSGPRELGLDRITIKAGDSHAHSCFAGKLREQRGERNAVPLGDANESEVSIARVAGALHQVNAAGPRLLPELIGIEIHYGPWRSDERKPPRDWVRKQR